MPVPTGSDHGDPTGCQPQGGGGPGQQSYGRESEVGQDRGGRGVLGDTGGVSRRSVPEMPVAAAAQVDQRAALGTDPSQCVVPARAAVTRERGERVPERTLVVHGDQGIRSRGGLPEQSKDRKSTRLNSSHVKTSYAV